ncbi:MAG: hypothetical protein AAFQ87_17070 [Bacteroidota bacterium]
MEPAKAYFDAIVKQYVIRFHQVQRGKWRDFDALLYNQKAFVAYGERGMHFCLGADLQTTDSWLQERAGLTEIDLVDQEWFRVPYPLKDIWAPLTESAFWYIKSVENDP